MADADPFHEKYETAKRIGGGSFGDVYLVRRRQSSSFFAAKLLDPTVQKYGTATQELKILQSLHHKCVIELTDVYGPYLPASSRQRNVLFRERQETVLVFPAYDLDLKWLLRLRKSCPEDFPAEHRTSICKDVFRGLAYLHGRDILHRDLKPANIFVRSSSTMRAVIGDVGLSTMMTSSPAAGEALTAHVCSDGYVAPELVQVRSSDSAVYGSEVDVWSAGVVAFEVCTLDDFLDRGAPTLEAIARRIGPSPVEYGSVGVGAGGLEACLRGHLLAIACLCLDWQPQRRATAAVVASHPAWDTGTVPDTVADGLAVRCELSIGSCHFSASSAAAFSTASTAIDADTGHYPSMEDRVVDLGHEEEVVEPALDLSGRACVCSGNCGNTGHRRLRCKAVATVASKFCVQCMCQWNLCGKARLWHGYCFKHSKMLTELSCTWKTVRAAKRLNPFLIPCDVPSFVEYYARHRCCLPGLMVAGFVKEPAPLEMLESEARMIGMNLHEPVDFRKGWLKVIRNIGDGEGQRFVELRQLTRNGAGRVSGLGPTLASVGILQPSSVAGNACADVRLGITRRGYDIVTDDVNFHKFWKFFSHEAWATACAEKSFATFCKSVRTMLKQVAQQTRAFRLTSEGYCFHFLYRKILIGEARFRKRSTSFAAVDWHALTVGDLKFMSADQNDHLDAFESHTSAGDLSYFFFGRADWPLLLSCFACLWRESRSEGNEVELAGSEALHAFAKSWRKENGIAPHPTNLLASYRGSPMKKTAVNSPLKKTTVNSKKRVAAKISTSDV